MSRPTRGRPESAESLWLAGKFAEAHSIDPLTEFRHDLPVHVLTRAEILEADRLRAERLAREGRTPRGRRRADDVAAVIERAARAADDGEPLP